MIAKKAPIDFDSYAHIYFIKELKNQRVGPFGTIKLKVAGNSGFNHQFLWYWLIGLIPIDLIIKFNKWINPLIDSLFTVFIFIICLRIQFTTDEALLISALYIFTPMWFSRLSIGPRINCFTPRLFSEVIVNIFYIVNMINLNLSLPFTLTLGTIFSSVVILSSKFGLQAILFMSLPISILSNNYNPLLSLFFGFLLSIIISKGSFIKSTKNQLNHLIWYFKDNLKGNMPISNRNRISVLFSEVNKNKNFLKNIKSVILKAISTNSFTSVIIKMPVLISGLIVWLITYSSDSTIIPEFVFAPVFSSLIIFILISMPYLLFLGEAERYLNHVAFFILLFTGMLLIEFKLLFLFYVLLLYGIFYWIIEVFFLNKFKKFEYRKEKINQDIINYLNKKDTVCTIITYPYHAVGIWRLMLETKHKVIFPNLDSRTGAWSANNWYEDKYPYIKLEVVDKIFKNLGANILIIDKQKLKNNWSPSKLWQEVEIGDSYYKVFQVVQKH